MNKHQEVRPHRIHYKKDDGTTGQYFIAAENAILGIADFALRTGYRRESVISVDVEPGRTWMRVL